MHRSLILAACCALAASGAARGADAPNRVSTGQRMADLSRDPRLARPVSFSAYRMYLGELLEQIAAKTGTTLEADERLAPLSGYELTVVVHERPAWEVLDAVRRLYLAGQDRWYWTAQSRAGTERYVLHNTAPPEAWARYREGLLRALLLEDFRRKKAQAAVPPPPGSRSFMPFLNRVSEQDLEAILIGQPLSFPAAEMTPEQRSALEASFAALNGVGRQNPLVQQGKVEHKDLRIEDVDNVGIARSESYGSGLPGIYVRASTMSGSLLGGLSLVSLLQHHVLQDWVAKDEQVKAPEQPVPAAGGPALPLPRPGTPPTLDRFLERLGRLGRLNLVYDRPVLGPSRFYVISRARAEGSLPDVLKQLDRENLVWKSKDPFLLFRLADWMGNPRDALVPWAVTRELRAGAGANGGFLREEDWVRLAGLRPAQREYLATEFPDGRELNRFPDLAAVLLLTAAMTPEERATLSVGQGSGWADWQARTQRRAVELFGQQRAHNVHVALRWNTDRPTPRLLYGLVEGTAPLRLAQIPASRCRLDPNTQFPETAAPPGNPAAGR